MKLQFLGTAAAEGYPGIFCHCSRCQQARLLGGRNLRYRSALLVNDDLLIDFGPDLLAAAQRFGRDLSQVTNGLVTHAHSDHFYHSNFEMRGGSFTGRTEIPMLDLFGPRDVKALLNAEYDNLDALRLRLHTVTAFDQWQHSGYQFHAYHAYHAVGHLEEALFYSVDDGKHAFLYATDTGPFPADSWRALENQSFDVIILEETMGGGTYNQHIGFEQFVEHARRMRASGMLRPGGRIIATHFSHSGNPLYDDLVAFFAPHAVEVAYDGLAIELNG